MNNSRLIRVIVLTYLFFGCLFIAKAQDEILVSPLTAQQFEHCEGDQYYVHFSRYAITAHWDEYVFSGLQHNNPVKSIKTKYYEERKVYDEPTMVEDKEKACTFDYTGDFFVLKKSGKRIWESDGIVHWLREYYPYDNDVFVFEAKNKNKKEGGITYIRDEKNRVKRVNRSMGNGTIISTIDYTYWENTDFIHTIKCYKGTDGKMTAEVKYDYLTSSKKILLNKVTCKIYKGFSYASEIYVYKLSYDASLNVNKVEVFFEENEGYKKQTTDVVINVNISRDTKGNIKKCICNQIKYEDRVFDGNGNLSSIDYNMGYNKNVTWIFDYDDNNNWITMTKTMNWNGSMTKKQIRRELVYDTSQRANSKTNTKSQSLSSNSSKRVYSNAYDGFVNIRQSPNSKAKILGVLRNGPEGAFLLGTEGEWKKIDCNGIVGYVSGKYVQDTPTEVFKGE